MTFRWCLWTRLKLALRKRPTPDSQLPYELDEFAELLCGRGSGRTQTNWPLASADLSTSGPANCELSEKRSSI